MGKVISIASAATRRNVFFVIAALCCLVNVNYSHAYDAKAVDTIPAPRYILNMSFEQKSCLLSFQDTFNLDHEMNRHYSVSLYARKAPGEGVKNPTSIYQYQLVAGHKGEKMFSAFDYGYYKEEKSGKIECNEVSTSRQSPGGYVHAVDMSAQLRKALATCLKKGHRNIRIVVNPERVISDGQGKTINYRSVYFGSKLGFLERGEATLHLINYHDITLKGVFANTLECPEKVKYGETFTIQTHIQGTGETSYKIQESSDGKNWHSVKTGKLSAVDAMKGFDFEAEIPFDESVMDASRYYRQIAKDLTSGVSDTTGVKKIDFYYLLTFKHPETTNTYYKRQGEFMYYSYPADCMEYQITSALPFTIVNYDEDCGLYMPACNVTFEEKDIMYKVRFLNGDYSLLDEQQVKCGANAVAPANPTLGDMKFKGWSKDFTNVHKDLTVLAQYDMGETFYYSDNLVKHINTLYPHEGFEGSDVRAMVGDTLTFRIELRNSAATGVAYQRGIKNDKGEWLWSGDHSVGGYTAEQAEQNVVSVFYPKISVAYENYNEMTFRYGEAFRFKIYSAGATFYSDPYEFDVYYETGIHSDGKEISVRNTFGDMATGNDLLFPTKYKDTIQVQMEKTDGACFEFERKIKTNPVYALETGINAQGKAYFVTPGEKENVEVLITKYAVVFENVHSSQWKEYDFSAEGLGKYNHAYYAEIVPCGGSIENIPEDPEWKGRIFNGWKNETTDEFDDDAYLNVTPIDGPVLMFTAQWEDLPEVPEYTVRFFEQDGKTQIGPDQTIKEGEDAVAPEVPEVDGWHFAGWDKEYYNITEDMDITAVYGDDSKSWTVTYLNWDDSELGSESVSDGLSAKGVTATREKGVFDHWENIEDGKEASLEHIWSDLTVRAVFAGTFYNVTFRVDGEVTYKTSVPVDTKFEEIVYPKDTPEMQSDAQYDYTFTGWTPEVATITEDVVFDAVFAESVRKYTVIFQDWDHTELSKQEVEYGNSAIAPEGPTREGYIFIKWDKKFSHVTSDLTITAEYLSAATSGICGPKLEWVFDEATYSLTITGEGDMFDYNLTDENDVSPWFWFAYSKKIKQVIVPEGMTSIGAGAFYLCLMSSFEIPAGVTKIGFGAFYGCTNLTSMVVPESVTMIGEMAFGICMNLKEIVLPEHLKTISFGLFVGCYTLESVHMPKELTLIGEEAFIECKNLTKIEIPAGVVKIGDDAFNETSLSEIHCFALTPPSLGNLVFEDVDVANCKLYVPKESIETYKATDVWKDFDIQELVTHTVTFVDYDGETILKSEEVADGGSAIAPADPTREGYTFTGWDKDFDVVTGDLIITAQYKKNEATGLDEFSILNSQFSTRKLLRNGIIYIERNGHLYNINGELVR